MEGKLSAIGGDRIPHGDAAGRVEPDGGVSDPFIGALGKNHAYNALFGYRGWLGNPHGEENHETKKRNVPSEHNYSGKNKERFYTAAWSDAMESHPNWARE
jgi:hypothetical protein